MYFSWCVDMRKGVQGMKDMKLSEEQEECLEYIKANGGVISRHKGGFWANADWKDLPDKYFSTNTIRALFYKGIITYSEYRFTRAGIKFAVKAVIKTKEGK